MTLYLSMTSVEGRAMASKLSVTLKMQEVSKHVKHSNLKLSQKAAESQAHQHVSDCNPL